MDPKARLERLRSLESAADDCIHELGILLPQVDFNPWTRISDKLQEEIASLEAFIEMEEI